VIIYVCPNCGRPHSLKEFKEDPFCPHCGKRLTYNNRRVLEEDKRNAIARTSIEKTYASIRKYIPSGNLIDSLEVVKQVEEYRQFWKPEKTNVVLLAESHVYTDENDYEAKCRSSILDEILLPENPNYPVNFVRFVYCLGYGENELLTKRPDRRNKGTPDYWKIFSSCVAESENDLENSFRKIRKSKKNGTSNLPQRIANKVNVLRKMRKKGIWLLDASIVGLAGSNIKEDPDACNQVIVICWDNYLRKVIKDAQPKHILVIGKGVEKSLRFRLQKLGFSPTVIRQPQGDRRNSQKQLEKYKVCQRICSRYCQASTDNENTSQIS